MDGAGAGSDVGRLDGHFSLVTVGPKLSMRLFNIILLNNIFDMSVPPTTVIMNIYIRNDNSDLYGHSHYFVYCRGRKFVDEGEQDESGNSYGRSA